MAREPRRSESDEGDELAKHVFLLPVVREHERKGNGSNA